MMTTTSVPSSNNTASTSAASATDDRVPGFNFLKFKALSLASEESMVTKALRNEKFLSIGKFVEESGFRINLDHYNLCLAHRRQSDGIKMADAKILAMCDEKHLRRLIKENHRKIVKSGDEHLIPRDLAIQAFLRSEEGFNYYNRFIDLVELYCKYAVMYDRKRRGGAGGGAGGGSSGPTSENDDHEL